MEKHRILVLGSDGFIGHHLIYRMIKKGSYYVCGIDKSYRRSPVFPGNNDLDLCQEDIYDMWGLTMASIEDADTVVFLASMCNPSQYMTEPLAVIDSNFVNPKKVVDYCTYLKRRLISFSTCEVYGRTVSSYVHDHYQVPSNYVQIEDETPLIYGPVHKQRWCYAAAKQLLDRYIYACGFEKQLPFSIIRPYNFFGPAMDYIDGIDGSGIPRVLSCFVKALLENKPLPLVDGGIARRTITYIDDAIDGIIKVIDNPAACNGEIFNIANPENELSIRELALIVDRTWQFLTGRKTAGMIEVSAKDFYKNGEAYEDCDRRVANIDKMKNLGWTPRYGIEETVRLTLQWYMDHYENDRRYS